MGGSPWGLAPDICAGHKRSHTGETPYRCQGCNMGFKRYVTCTTECAVLTVVQTRRAQKTLGARPGVCRRRLAAGEAHPRRCEEAGTRKGKAVQKADHSRYIGVMCVMRDCDSKTRSGINKGVIILSYPGLLGPYITLSVST